MHKIQGHAVQSIALRLTITHKNMCVIEGEKDINPYRVDQ